MTPERVEAARVGRRKQAEQAWMDAAIDPDPERNCVTATIEVATRVQLGDEIVEQGRAALRDQAYGYLDHFAARVIIKAAFEAAGFEVE